MQLKHFKSADFENFERIFRANLIGTISDAGQPNLAIFSSVIHLGANPALLGFIQRPVGAESHTYKNILETGYFTISHVQESFVAQAHQSSARYPRDISEFDACQLTPEYLDGFRPPYVGESQVKIGLRFMQEVPITLNNTILVIGQIKHLYVPENLLHPEGNILLDALGDVCISGLDTYYAVSKLLQLPYAKAPE